MDRDSIKATLKTFTQRELIILAMTCQGKKYEEIGEYLNYSTEYIQLYMSGIYRKLGINKGMHWTKRRDFLKNEVCPTLKELSTQKEELEEIKGDTSITPVPDMELLPLVIEDELVIKLEEEGAATRTEEPKEKREQRRPRLGVIFSIVGLIILAVICFVGFGFVRGSLQPPQPTRLALVSFTPPPTPTNVAQATLNPFFYLTSTAEALNNPAFTPKFTTSTPAPFSTLPPVSLPFTDNFDNKYSASWIIRGDQPFIVNKELSTTGTTWLFLGNSQWKNYTIEFVAGSGLGDCYEYAQDPGPANNFALRVVDFETYVGISWSYCGYHWFIENKGNYFQIPNTAKFWNVYAPATLSIVVQGNTFQLLFNGNKASEITLSSDYSQLFQAGGIGIKFQKALTIKSVRIYPN